MRRPDCGWHTLDVDFTGEFNAEQTYELVCYECGWFSADRYETREAAEMAADGLD